MLNLNYNINKALGGKECIGVMKYNYSASISVYGAGGGGATDTQAGGGGGGGMVVSQSISIVPNITYQINVGAGGAVDNDGQDSKLIGFDDIDSIPIAFYAQGGRKGLSTGNGGNSGTGSIVREGITTSYLAFTGGTVFSTVNAFGPQKGAGGGASNAANGQNGSDGFGGNGGNGESAGGGGGAFFVGPTGPYGDNGGNGAGNYGSGGNGYSNQQNGQTNPLNAQPGSDGAVVISYTGKTKAILTGNVTSSFTDGVTTHVFRSGSGTFTYQFPYPYEQPATPYQVVLCPPLYR